MNNQKDESLKSEFTEVSNNKPKYLVFFESSNKIDSMGKEWMGIFTDLDNLLPHKEYGNPTRIFELGNELNSKTYEPLVQTIDVNKILWEEIEAAFKDMKGVPPDYFVNDIVSDICTWLKTNDWGYRPEEDTRIK